DRVGVGEGGADGGVGPAGPADQVADGGAGLAGQPRLVEAGQQPDQDGGAGGRGGGSPAAPGGGPDGGGGELVARGPGPAGAGGGGGGGQRGRGRGAGAGRRRLGGVAERGFRGAELADQPPHPGAAVGRGGLAAEVVAQPGDVGRHARGFQGVVVGPGERVAV